jgi:tRNA-(ms[2]io[6]A)-hydroxylase
VIVSQTDPGWVDVATANMDAVLVDHAHCEKKAAASAMSLVVGYPEREELVRRMSALAVEELQHFRAVYERIVERGLSLGRDQGDPYAKRLTGLARPHAGRLTDRLLIFGLIEARSHERLELLGAHLKAPELKRFYGDLAKAESRHAALFKELACRYDDVEAVEVRLRELAASEAEIVANLPLEPRIH